MSLEIDLSKLNKLIKKFHVGTFNEDDYRRFMDLTASVRSQSDLLMRAQKRSDSYQKLQTSVEQMTVYAQNHQMPKFVGYSSGHQIFRTCLLPYGCYSKHDKNNGIFLVSQSIFNGKEIKPGVYYWQHPPAGGWDGPDSVDELTPEYVKSLDLPDRIIEQILEKARDIINDDRVTSVTKDDLNKKYKERWPDTAWFNSCEGIMDIDELDELGKLDVEQISTEFDVDINIDFEDCRVNIFGPMDNVRRLVDYFSGKIRFNLISSGSNIELARGW